MFSEEKSLVSSCKSKEKIISIRNVTPDCGKYAVPNEVILKYNFHNGFYYCLSEIPLWDPIYKKSSSYLCHTFLQTCSSHRN